MASTLYLYVVHVHVGIYGNPNNKKYKRRAESIVDMFSFNCIHLWFIIIIIICFVFFYRHFLFIQRYSKLVYS